MSGLESFTRGPGRLQEVRFLVALKREDVVLKGIEELADMFLTVSRELLDYRDVTCGAESAARFFNRKRSWVYEAMSRPHTELQRRLADLAIRQHGGLLFRLSDLVALRCELFDGNLETCQS